MKDGPTMDELCNSGRFGAEVCRDPESPERVITFYPSEDPIEGEEIAIDWFHRRLAPTKRPSSTPPDLSNATARQWYGLFESFMCLKESAVYDNSDDVSGTAFDKHAIVEQSCIRMRYGALIPSLAYTPLHPDLCGDRSLFMEDEYCIAVPCDCGRVRLRLYERTLAGDMPLLAEADVDIRRETVSVLGNPSELSAQSMFEGFVRRHGFRGKDDLDDLFWGRGYFLSVLYGETYSRTTPSKASATPDRIEPFVANKTPGRNEPCPCGSGRKYKKCCARR